MNNIFSKAMKNIDKQFHVPKINEVGINKSLSRRHAILRTISISDNLIRMDKKKTIANTDCDKYKMLIIIFFYKSLRNID